MIAVNIRFSFKDIREMQLKINLILINAFSTSTCGLSLFFQATTIILNIQLMLIKRNPKLTSLMIHRRMQMRLIVKCFHARVASVNISLERHSTGTWITNAERIKVIRARFAIIEPFDTIALCLIFVSFIPRLHHRRNAVSSDECQESLMLNRFLIKTFKHTF